MSRRPAYRVDRAVETPNRYAHNEQARAGLELAAERLTAEQRDWLANLPQGITIADGRYRLVHSHPDPDRLGTYVSPRAFPRMRPYLDRHDGIGLGHTHVQHEASIDGRVIINPGSVGQPRDGDRRAAYAILDTASSSVEFRRVSYDIDRVISRVAESPFPVGAGTRLLDGT